MTITVTDLFCGAGGSSLGATAIKNVQLVMAANHWATAIDVHQAHFPNARHDCADISQADPRRYPATNILLASPECFPAGTLVTTLHGQVPIESVKVGDVALTHLGRWKRVVRTQDRFADTVILSGQGHTAGLGFTENHRLWARTSKKQGHLQQRVWAEPDWLAADHTTAVATYWATPTQCGATMPIWPVPIGQEDAAWWVVGRWLGDGSLTFGRNHEVLISCGNHEADELEVRLAQTSLVWRRGQKRTAVVFCVGHRGLRDWLHDEFGHGSANKGLPGWIYGLTTNQRTELLEGYVSADGHRSARRTRIDTVSKKLAISVRLLAESLGYRASLYRYPQHCKTIEGRALNVLDIWVASWENNRSTREAFEEDGLAWSRIRTMEPGRRHVRVYNIEIEGDHSYIADGIAVANCTNHSQARGVSRKSQQADLFGDYDPAAERSRATMWCVGRFAEQIPYDAIIVENVVEATKWAGWTHWLGWLTDLGYHHKVLSTNSMHHRVPQSRDRIYVVFWRKGLNPNLELEVDGWCPRCDRWGPARQAWKPQRTIGRYRQQWTWACTTCGHEAVPVTEPAASIIDWQLACPRIGDRARPLADATRLRILAGLQRYGWVPISTAGAGHVWEGTPGMRARPLTDPLPTQHTTATTAVATPPAFLVSQREGIDRRVHPISEPLGTVTSGGQNHGLVTVAAGGLHHGLLMRNNGGGAEMVTPVTEPARTITTAGHQSLLMPYNRTSVARPVSEPAPTVTTKDRCALINPEHVVDDCGFRMLEPHEIAAAMAFPAGYIPDTYTKKDRVRLAGNAVTPPVMAWIVGRVAQALEQAS